MNPFDIIPTTLQADEASGALLEERERQQRLAQITEIAQGLGIETEGVDPRQLIEQVQTAAEALPDDDADEGGFNIRDALARVVSTVGPLGGFAPYVGKGLNALDDAITGAAGQDRQINITDDVSFDRGGLGDVVDDARNMPGIIANETLDPILNAGKATWDALATQVQGEENRNPEDIPWSTQYEWAVFDFGQGEAKTPVGNFAAQILKFVAVGKVAGPNVIAQFGGDAILDFLQDPNDGNLSTWIQAGPLANPLSKALAHQDEDNQWVRRIKNSLEGAAPNIAIQAFQTFYKALRKGRAAVLAGKSPEEVAVNIQSELAIDPPPTAASRAAAAENTANSGRPAMYHGTYMADRIREQGFRPSTGDNPLGDGVYFTTDAQLARAYGPQEIQGYLDEFKIKDLTIDELAEMGYNVNKPDPTFLRNTFGGEFDGVRVKGFYDRSADIDEIVIFDPAKANEVLQYTPEKPGMIDPQERVVQIDKAEDVNNSVVSFWDNPEPGGGNSLVDEVDIASLKTEDALKEYITSRIPELDIDDISRRLGLQSDQMRMQTFQSLAEFADSGDLYNSFEPLLRRSVDGVTEADTGYKVVLDTFIKSVGDRISTLADDMTRQIEAGQPFKTQSTAILDRAELLIKSQREVKRSSSFQLSGNKDVAPGILNNMDDSMREVDDLFAELRQLSSSTDPLDVQQYQKKMALLGLSMTAAKGDPNLQTSVLGAIAKTSWAKAMSNYINGLLSGPITQIRNIGGNFVVGGERVVSRAIGGYGGMSFAAFDSFLDTLGEAFRVGRESFGSPYAIVTPGSKVVDYVKRDRGVLEAALKAASNPGERLAASSALWFFDFTNSPWYNWPGKALQAGDDFSKTLFARMDLRFDAAVEADKLAKNADPKAATRSREEIYQELVKKKIKPNGQIIDSKLIGAVEEATFQKELTGSFAKVGNAMRDLPGGRLSVPFYNTGVNVSEYGFKISPIGQFLPEYKRIMKSGTEAEKAIARGRVALGYGITASAVGLATAGVMTGYGPPPGPERDRWLLKNEPMSIKVGDKWVSYQIVPGFSMVMAVTADMTYAAGRLSKGDQEYVLNAIPWTLASIVGTQPLFQGILDYAALLDKRSWNPEKLRDMFGNYVNNAGFGGGALRRNLENLLTDGMTEYRNWADDFINVHQIAGTLSGGLAGRLTGNRLGATVPTINPLTGEQVDNRYTNPLNLLNPFTVIGKDQESLVDVLDSYDYDIRLSAPDRVRGVNLTPDEAYIYNLALYDNGSFPEALRGVILSSKFERAYQRWRAERSTPKGVPKEESEWWDMLDRVQTKAAARARRELMFGNSDVSQNWRDTYPQRARKAASGNAGNMTPEQTQTLRDLLVFSNQQRQ